MNLTDVLRDLSPFYTGETTLYNHPQMDLGPFDPPSSYDSLRSVMDTIELHTYTHINEDPDSTHIDIDHAENHGAIDDLWTGDMILVAGYGFLACLGDNNKRSLDEAYASRDLGHRAVLFDPAELHYDIRVVPENYDVHLDDIRPEHIRAWAGIHHGASSVYTLCKYA